MYETGRCPQVVGEMERYNLNILDLSEVRWPGQGEKSSSQAINYYTMYIIQLERMEDAPSESQRIILPKNSRLEPPGKTSPRKAQRDMEKNPRERKKWESMEGGYGTYQGRDRLEWRVRKAMVMTIMMMV